jgi:hypothetical protein
MAGGTTTPVFITPGLDRTMAMTECRGSLLYMRRSLLVGVTGARLAFCHSESFFMKLGLANGLAMVVEVRAYFVSMRK